MAFEELKDRIKESPVSMVLSHYMSLNKKGANLEGICPFHPDTKPSLKVNDAKGMYKCFVCGAGGDAITFVKEFKRVEFVDALREIAGILGLPFDEQKEKKKNPKVEMAFRVLNASNKIYKKYSETNPLQFVEFIQKRKLTEESIEKFQIGFSPSNNSLYHYLQTIPGADGDFAMQTAKEISLIRYNEDRNSHYDFYRERVMFPIHDTSGQIRGYSSRAVREEQVPKYLNSVESVVFNKGSILFGLYFAKNAIRQLDQVIIVEGNMDVIIMHQFGFHQTIATMGTAFSEQSARLLSNMTKNVYLGMDSDNAGKKAMQKINADFMGMGILPKFLTFEPAKDPDEFLITEGRLALMERIEKAPLVLDVLISELIPEKIPENIQIKLQIMQRIYEVVSPLKENLHATEKVVAAGKTLGLLSDSATILKEYGAHLSRQKEKTTPLIQRPSVIEDEEISIQKDIEARILHEELSAQELPPLNASEKRFLREILCHPEFLTHLQGDEFLAYIGHDEVKKLVQWLINIYREIDDAEYVSIVQEELQQGGYCKEVKDIGTDALFHYGNRYNEKVVQKMLKDYILNLRKDQLKSKRDVLAEKQKTAPSQIEVEAILGEIQELNKQIHNLSKSPLG